MMDTTETTPAPESDGISPGRAACETFWAAVEAGPSSQEPGAAWNWAKSQRATAAWEAAAKAGASTVERELDGARAELVKLRRACKTLGSVIVSQSLQMEAARIEMRQNGPEAAMKWILSTPSEMSDCAPEDRWNGTETAAEWIERQRAADRAWEAAKAADAGPCCTGCGPDCGYGGTPHEAPVTTP